MPKKIASFCISTPQILLSCLVFCAAQCASPEKKYVVILDPAGNDQYAGRVIENTFERGISLQCAQAIKQELEKRDPACTVQLTRIPAQPVTSLQHASLANRMSADLYLSLHFFQETGIKPSVYFYQFSYNDDQLPLAKELAFYPYDQAHRLHGAQTSALVGMLKATLSTDAYKKVCEVKGACKLPFAPLIGIIAPAVGLEAGLIHGTDWHILVEPIVQTIVAFKGHA